MAPPAAGDLRSTGIDRLSSWFRSWPVRATAAL